VFKEKYRVILRLREGVPGKPIELNSERCIGVSHEMGSYREG